MIYHDYFFKCEYEERKRQLNELLFTKRMTPIKKTAKKRMRFNPFSRKKHG